MKTEIKKYCAMSHYYGGHDALNGLNKKGRARFFKNNFIQLTDFSKIKPQNYFLN